LPDSWRVRAALQACELVVVSDVVRHTDTTQYAHVLLPAQAWGEKEGTVTNSERRISRQRAFLPTQGEARPDWWIVAEVARRMGFEAAFGWQRSADVWREHAALSGFENNGQRDFDVSGLAAISDAAYETLPPVQWPVNAMQPHGTARLFGEGRFFTDTGKAKFVAVGERTPANAPAEPYPLVLNSGRVRDHWHTLTRTGKSPRLSGHIVEPYVEIHPQDASRYAVADQGLAKVTSAWGEAVLRVRVHEAQQVGSLFIPMHWNQQYSSLASVNCLINPATDPVSGQPEFKHTPVSVAPYTAAWYGFVLSRRRLAIQAAGYWSAARGKGMWRYEVAGEQPPGDWASWARGMLCSLADKVEWMEYFDAGSQRYRAARLVSGALESCIFIGPEFNLPSRDWLAQLFEQEVLDDNARSSLLTGKPAKGQKDAGRIVCACFSVGVNTIVDAIQSQHLTSAEQIGAALKAGTNCGSCVPELKALLVGQP
jgi:assimilatory nitrate reductase catalytic subunit